MADPRWKQVQAVNRLPINQAAKMHLPPDRQADGTMVYLLALAELALEKAPREIPAGLALADVEAAVLELDEGDPAEAVEFLLRETGLQPEALAQATPEQAQRMALAALTGA